MTTTPVRYPDPAFQILDESFTKLGVTENHRLKRSL